MSTLPVNSEEAIRLRKVAAEQVDVLADDLGLGVDAPLLLYHSGDALSQAFRRIHSYRETVQCLATLSRFCAQHLPTLAQYTDRNLHVGFSNLPLAEAPHGFSEEDVIFWDANGRMSVVHQLLMYSRPYMEKYLAVDQRALSLGRCAIMLLSLAIERERTVFEGYGRHNLAPFPMSREQTHVITGKLQHLAFVSVIFASLMTHMPPETRDALLANGIVRALQPVSRELLSWSQTFPHHREASRLLVDVLHGKDREDINRMDEVHGLTNVVGVVA